MAEELKEELRRLGAEVKPSSELPSEAREMITRYAPGIPGRGRVGVELKRLAAEQVYVYEDERLRLTIPVPSVEVFEAVVRELERLGPDVADIHEYVTILARAFWLLHQRPGRRGWWAKLRRNKYVVPDVDEKAALELLYKKVRRADVAVKSLAPALFGLLEHVIHKKKRGGRPARFCSLAELAVEVAGRFHISPEAVLAWNAAKFYAVVECLVNSAREAEAAAEEERKKWETK